MVERRTQVTSFARFCDALRDAGCTVIERGNDRANAQAPGHSPADRSISILYNPVEGRTAFMSFADDRDHILDTLGLTWADLFDNPQGARYDYGDGRTVYRTPDKKFRQAGNTKGSALFHADRIPAADTVYVVEGEHDVLTLEQAGVTATCTAMGAGKAHMFDLTPLHGKDVVIVQDMDSPGAAHAAQVAELLAPHAKVTVVQPKVGKDAADHITAGHTVDEFTPVTAAEKHIAFATIARELEHARDMTLADGLEHLRATINRLAPVVDDTALKSVEQLLGEWWEWIEGPNDSGRGRVIPTPWPELNDVLAGGFHAGRSYLFAGRPGTGKSLGLSNFAAYAALKGSRGLLYSVEMSGLEIMSRMLSAGAKAEYKQVTRRELDAYNLGRIATFVESFEAAPLYISDRASLTLPRIASEARKMKSDQGLDFIAVDYMQLLKSNLTDRQQALTAISRETKILAGELDVAMVSACQLNRDNAKHGRRPILSDLRESGAIEQDCDVAILLHHPETSDGYPTGEVELIVAKNRTGPLVTITAPWRPHYARIG